MNRNTPPTMKMPRVFTPSAAVNAGRRKRSRSISGSRSRRWRRRNSVPTTTPAAIATNEAAPASSAAICFTPKITARTATSDIPALGISNRPGAGSRNSGSSRGAMTSSTAITGTASRNTDPHQRYSSMNPPTSGPIAAPTEKLMAQIPIATWRCWASRNMLRMSERVDGASVAPAIPSSARVTISISALVENAARTETAPNAAAPIIRSRRRPMRSPSVPIVMRPPARRKP